MVVALVATGLLQLLSLFVLMPAFTVGGLETTDEAGDASNTCEGYTQEFETGEEVEGHVEPPLDTADWYGFDITSDDVTAADAGHVLSEPNGTPVQVEFFDTNANTFFDPFEPVYLVAFPGDTSVGDVRLTPNGPKAAGTKVTGSDSDLNIPTMFLTGEAAIHDPDADAAWSWGDSLYWDLSAGGTVSPGDIRLTDQATHAAGTVVSANDTDVGQLLIEMPVGGDAQIHDIGVSGYDITDPVYGDFANFGVVGSLDVRLSGADYGSIVAVQTIYIVLQETASQEGYHVDSDAREVEEDLAGRHCSESVVGEEDGKQISAKLTPYTCDATKWSFVINQIKPGVTASPESIHIQWSNGFEIDVNREKFTGKVAHYTTSLNLVSPVTEATAFIYEEWSGRFNLERGPCFAEGGLLRTNPARSPSEMSHTSSDCVINPDKQQWGNTTVISFQATQPCTFSIGVHLVQDGGSADAFRPSQRAAAGGGCHDFGCVLYTLGFEKERDEDDECVDCHPPTL